MEDYMALKRCIATVVGAFLLAAVLLSGRAVSVQAAPAAPGDVTITQPDGSHLVVRLWGDEWSHGMETLDGYTVVQDAGGYWVYAGVQSGGMLAPAVQNGRSLVAGRDAPGSLEKHARPANTQQNTQHAQQNTQQGLQKTSVSGQNFGTQPVLLVMVDFANTPHIYDPAVFQASFFGATNSIADYYKNASFNNLTIGKATEIYGTANDGVVGWLRLAGTFSLSTDWSQVAYNAISAADPYIDYSAYDTDGNGYVTSTELHLVIVVSGYEQSYCGSNCLGIWAHRGGINNLYLDNVHLGTNSTDGQNGGYAMFGEIHGNGATDANKHPATIGVMIHELGHDLSWPDLYDTNGSTGGYWEGAGAWSIMGVGSWNGLSQPGDSPSMPDAYLKAYQGWITPTVASSGSTYNILDAFSNPYALQLGVNSNGIDWEFTNHSGTGEFWMVENRQQTGYDAALPYCGILIWHIDESVSSANDANGNRDKPLEAVEEADGDWGLYNGTSYGDWGDTFPGATGKMGFGNATLPSSYFHVGGPSGSVVTVQATQCASSMQVQYTKQMPVLNNRLFLPITTKPALIASGKVTYRGAAVGGVTISMDYTRDGWYNWDTIFATTDASGNYSFGANTPQINGSLEEYQVYYNNLEKNMSRLSYWNCYARYESGGSDTCNIEIADVTQRTPGAGATLKLPGYVGWNLRTLKTDSYQVAFYEDSGPLSCWTYELGYVNQFKMTSLSANLNCQKTMHAGQKYWRAMYVYGPNGYGRGMFWWPIYFNGPAAPGLPLEMKSSLTDPQFSHDALMSRYPALRFGPLPGGAGR
jgi:M6 family metalloprotease-like protein